MKTLLEELTCVPMFGGGGEMLTSDQLAQYGARRALEMALEKVAPCCMAEGRKVPGHLSFDGVKELLASLDGKVSR